MLYCYLCLLDEDVGELLHWDWADDKISHTVVAQLTSLCLLSL